jgi:small-conductance mechanosensitive channel
MDQSTIIYLIVTGVVGLLILWWFRKNLSRIEEERIHRLENMHRFEAVKSQSPIKNPLKKAKTTALESIGSRYSIIRRTIYGLIYIVWITALIFPFLGNVPSAMVSFLGGAIAVILGIAARPFIENMISGIVISYTDKLRTGDTITVDNQFGTVEDISMTHTVIKSWDWRRYIIPNNRMLNKEYTNHSFRETYIWEHVEFWVSYDADLAEVEELALKIASDNHLTLTHDPPRFWVMGMEKEAINCWVATWVKNPSDAWTMKCQVRKQLSLALKERGILPHTYIHHGTDFMSKKTSRKPRKESTGEEKENE